VVISPIKYKSENASYIPNKDSSYRASSFPQYLDVEPQRIPELVEKGIYSINGDEITVNASNGIALYRIIEKPDLHWWIAERVSLEMFNEFGQLEQLYEKINQETDRVARLHEWHPCRKGCSDCCHYSNFLVSETEANYIFDLVRSWGKYRLREIQSRARSELSRLHQEIGYGKWNKLVARYPGERVTCPLLEDDVCTVYERRPVICRVYGLSGIKDEGKHMYACPKVEKAMYEYLQSHETVEMVDFSKITKQMEGILHGELKPLVAWLGE
jgi:Fe-S-cluster containining protein